MRTVMHPANIRIGVRQNPARGFTLIEVLVVLALTLIMMAAFAQIFSMTGNFVTKQKGMGENDQAARILTTVLKADLGNRTMRYVAPFHPNMQALPDEPLRSGYFEYSENNPLDDTDDVLQFTVALPNGQIGKPLINPTTQLPIPPFYGTATFLPKQTWQGTTAYATGAYVIPQAGSQTGFIYCATTGGTTAGGQPAWPTTTTGPTSTVNDGSVVWQCVDSTLQPDGDDGVVFPISPLVVNPTGVLSTVMLPQTQGAAGVYPIFPMPYATNNTGSSPYAEVTYFLRHGNLYRRVLLIRQPYNSAGSTQPGGAGLPPIINGAYNGTFWADFDYAARFDGVLGGPRFFDQTDLNNSPAAAYTSNTFPLGRPDNRFGHDHTNGTATQTDTTTTLGPVGTWPLATQTGNGAPREYDSNGVFLGRYTDEETSNQAFAFPGSVPAPGSPMAQATPANINTTSGAPTTGSVNEYTGTPVGTRRGEDILLTNVVSFDVKIWDPHYSESAGNDVNRNGVIDAGPAFADVGHNALSGDFMAANNALPSYGPHASQQNGAAPFNQFTVGTVTYYNNVFDTWFRTFNFDNIPKTYDTADSSPPNNAYAAAPYRPRIGVPWTAGVNYTAGTLIDPGPGTSANGFVYQCMTGGTAGATNPFSLTDTPNPPAQLSSLPAAGAVIDGTVQWNAIAPVAVQSIQITVKYLDPTQNLLRQVTIVQALTP